MLTILILALTTIFATLHTLNNRKTEALQVTVAGIAMTLILSTMTMLMLRKK
jgi:hypothetical protein